MIYPYASNYIWDVSLIVQQEVKKFQLMKKKIFTCTEKHVEKNCSFSSSPFTASCDSEFVPMEAETVVNGTRSVISVIDHGM